MERCSMRFRVEKKVPAGVKTTLIIFQGALCHHTVSWCIRFHGCSEKCFFTWESLHLHHVRVDLFWSSMENKATIKAGLFCKSWISKCLNLCVWLCFLLKLIATKSSIKPIGHSCINIKHTPLPLCDCFWPVYRLHALPHFHSHSPLWQLCYRGLYT